MTGHLQISLLSWRLCLSVSQAACLHQSFSFQLHTCYALFSPCSPCPATFPSLQWQSSCKRRVNLLAQLSPPKPLFCFGSSGSTKTCFLLRQGVVPPPPTVRCTRLPWSLAFLHALLAKDQHFPPFCCFFPNNTREQPRSRKPGITIATGWIAIYPSDSYPQRYPGFVQQLFIRWITIQWIAVLSAG